MSLFVPSEEDRYEAGYGGDTRAMSEHITSDAGVPKHPLRDTSETATAQSASDKTPRQPSAKPKEMVHRSIPENEPEEARLPKEARSICQGNQWIKQQRLSGRPTQTFTSIEDPEEIANTVAYLKWEEIHRKRAMESEEHQKLLKERRDKEQEAEKKRLEAIKNQKDRLFDLPRLRELDSRRRWIFIIPEDKACAEYFICATKGDFNHFVLNRLEWQDRTFEAVSKDDFVIHLTENW